MLNYVLIGGAGFVAPRHYRAIKETGGNLIAILDTYDSVGIIDSYFKDCKYFKEYERFDRFCIGKNIHYAVICSPNYLHDAHCIWALRSGFNVICEKPLVLNPRNLDHLLIAEEEYGGRVWNILQLRLSPLLQTMKPYITQCNQVKVVYYTPRGDWYDYSWKGDVQKSGNTIFNIGVHLIDLLLYLFGTDWHIDAWMNRKRKCMGHIKIGDTKVIIELSIEKDKDPTRTFVINGHEFDLSKNFGDLHTLSYQKILAGEGFGIKDVFSAIDLCSRLRDI